MATRGVGIGSVITIPDGYARQAAQLDQRLVTAISAPVTTTPKTPPKVAPKSVNATSPNKDENPTVNAPSCTAAVYASGNATTENTGIQKSNATLSHACDTGKYVKGALFQVGAFGGQIVKKIRDAIKAILAFLGFNPASSGIVSKLKKLAQDIKDEVAFIKEITDTIKGYLVYVNAVKQLITYILSLPAVLIAYFDDCIKLLQKQLVSGFQTALGADTLNPTDNELTELTDAIKDVQNLVSEAQSTVTDLTSTVTGAIGSLTTLEQIGGLDPAKQAKATSEVFAAAGFSNDSNKYSIA